MTVAELRKKLEEFPDDKEVIASVRDGDPIRDVTLAENWPIGEAVRKTVVMIS